MSEAEWGGRRNLMGNLPLRKHGPVPRAVHAREPVIISISPECNAVAVSRARRRSGKTPKGQIPTDFHEGIMPRPGAFQSGGVGVPVLGVVQPDI